MNGLNLVQVSWDVADLVQILRSDLRDVQINQLAVVGIDLCQLLLGEIFHVEPFLDVDAFVGKDHRRMMMVVTWSLRVEDPQVVVLFVLVNREVEVGLGNSFSVDSLSESLFFFFLELILEVKVIQFLLQQLADLGLDIFQVGMISFVFLTQT